MTTKAGKDMESKLHDYLIDTYAMEHHVRHQLDELISAAEDDDMRQALERHRVETDGQIDRLAALLEEHYVMPAVLRNVTARLALLFKALGDTMAEDKAAKVARDAFVIEHLEIAAYELLERIAVRAHDKKTVEVARANRAEEEGMASMIAARWDHVVDEVLAAEGIPGEGAQAPGS
jgi:ferritin-like metal-binding protein YciE